MATVQTRPFSKNYSGLINQSVLAGCIIVISLVAHEVLVRRRRGKYRETSVRNTGSIESWQFGYLFQARSWAKIPSPRYPRAWPLSWVKEAIFFPESDINKLRGVDAALYCRWMRGCFWFTLLHAFTTTVILLPIHITLSDPNQFSSKSMDRALISSLVQTTKGLRLLWIHLVLMLWVSLTWMYTLVWISKGVFHYRADSIESCANKFGRNMNEGDGYRGENPHPHPQHPFHAMPLGDNDEKNRGLKLRTIMITNIPTRLRSERELQEYFEYYMSRPLAKPSIGLTSTSQPGMVNKMVSFLINRLKKLELFSQAGDLPETSSDVSNQSAEGARQEGRKPGIERVVLVRKMTELSSLLDRREDVLRKLETAHIKLARKTLTAVKYALMRRKISESSFASRYSSNFFGHPSLFSKNTQGSGALAADIEAGKGADGKQNVGSDYMDILVQNLAPYLKEFDTPIMSSNDHLLPGHRSTKIAEKQPASHSVEQESTVWDVLCGLPRPALDPYQPLIHLSSLFRGKTVPAIDYYTAKIGLLTSLITENRSRPITDFQPVSTAFVTFSNPDDARKACKYLAVHPNNPLACLVTMAPEYEDLDWVRVMKQTYRTEILKDWVIDLGVWVFTIAWIIPVSLLVALVSISNIATVIPGLARFLNRHYFLEELIQSLLPTILTSLLALLIPIILLLIAKKAHTINTLSSLHDRILTRYHKFLVSNVLVFFCVGVTALESFFTSFRSSSLNILQEVGDAFPAAGPFYVGWFIFTTAIHGGFELCLFGLPLFSYPVTQRQITPRKRAVGIRPRTFNYYYWLPNHLLVIFITLVFAILNPLLMPFAVIYFAFNAVIIKNQLLYVYAKNYEGNGHLLLIRLGRYSLDGLTLAQVIFLGFLAVVKKEVHVALTAVMIVFTVAVKLLFTRICRTKFEAADIAEANAVCGTNISTPSESRLSLMINASLGATIKPKIEETNGGRFKTWKLPKRFGFSYSAVPHKNQIPDDHKPIPFSEIKKFKRIKSWSGRASFGNSVFSRRVGSMPDLEFPHASDALIPPRRVTSLNEKPPLVAPHEKFPAWDDNACLDRPYDNPYYSRSISNHLWLPRDPLGLLDLDDTVDVFRALTSDHDHGQLGEWVEGGIAMTELPSVTSIPEQGPRPPISRELSGAEDIVLPAAIAERVHNIGNEDEVEFTDDARSSRISRPSLLTRHTSSFSSPKLRRPSVSLARPSTFDSLPGPSRIRSSSFMTSKTSLPFVHKQPSRQQSSQVDPATIHAQARFARSHLSLASVGASNIAIQQSEVTDTSTSAPVSTREAVMGEVIAEEYHETENRLREEEDESKQAEEPTERSWLTSWMFSRIPWSS